MPSAMKLGVYLLIGAFAVWAAISIAKSLLALLLPLAIVGGIGLILYSMISRRALGGGRKYLP